jgi:hypothetical protein
MKESYYIMAADRGNGVPHEVQKDPDIIEDQFVDEPAEPAHGDAHEHRRAAPRMNSNAMSGPRCVPATVAATAAWKITMAAASLKRPSLCSTVMSRRGMCPRPATD